MYKYSGNGKYMMYRIAFVTKEDDSIISKFGLEYVTKQKSDHA